jgi:hypothetical protein
MKKIYTLGFALFFLSCAAMAQLHLFEDNFSAGISFVAFGGSTNNLVPDGTNARPGSPGTASLKVDVPAAGYTGGALQAATNQNVSSFNAVTFWAKASKAVTLNVTGLGNNGTTKVFGAERNVTLTTAWVKVIIPLPAAAKLSAIDGMWHFAEGSDEGAYTLWFDDIQYENVAGGIIGTPTVVMGDQTLTKPIGGTLSGIGIKATFPINSVNTDLFLEPAHLTYTSNPVGRITFDAAGVGTAATAGNATVTATLGAVAVAGTINVTVTSGPNAPTTAAPTPPARAPQNVISVFSNAYTNIGGVNFNPNWGQSTQFSEVPIAGNATLRYGNLTYQGFEIAPAMNLTSMTRMHFDIWTADNTQFQFFLISPGPVETPTNVTPTLGGWQSIDVPLTSFTPVVLNNVFQMKIVGQPQANGVGSNTVYVDNIYFHNDITLPVTLTAFTATKKDKSVLLNWKTSSETNNKGFSVERSADGQKWSEIAFVKSISSNGLGNTYTTTDNAPAGGNNFYRLKQVDLDGSFEYSAVKLVTWSTNTTALSVFPNPAKGRVQVNVPNASGKLFYTIVQLNGKTVLTGNFIGATHTIDVSQLASGSYLIQVTGNEFTKTEKLIIQ